MSALTSYDNLGGKGNRLDYIIATSDVLFTAGGNITKLIDGRVNITDGYFSSSNIAGKYMRFEFLEKVLINEITWLQGFTGTYTHGIWQVQGSNNGTDWENIGSTFTLGSTKIINTLQLNSKFYKFYQLLGISGKGNGNPPIYEIEFKLITEEPNIMKYLIKSQNKIHTLFKGEWIETPLAEPLAQEDYEQHGMDSLEDVPVNFINQLEEFEILTWTTNLEENPKLEFTTDEYKPIMTLHEPEIITMTDVDNPKLHIEGFRNLVPYCESENPDLLILSKSKPNIYTNLIPNPQLILPKGDIQFKMLDKVLSFNMTATEQNKGLIRLIFSIDSGTTWQRYDTNTLEFKQIDIQDLEIVEDEGMTVDIFNSIGTKWNEVVQNSKIRFGYYLKIDDMSDVANVDKLEVTIDVLGTWDAVLHEVDYNYEYDNEKIYIELYRDGSYKINYI